MPRSQFTAGGGGVGGIAECDGPQNGEHKALGGLAFRAAKKLARSVRGTRGAADLVATYRVRGASPAQTAELRKLSGMSSPARAKKESAAIRETRKRN